MVLKDNTPLKAISSMQVWSGISSATFGDGDAGQNSNGKERKTDVNEWGHWF